MQFFIHFVSSVTAAEEPHVVKLPVVFDLGHAARDDIDVELNGQCDKPVPDFIRILRQPANGLRFADIVEPRHKRSVEIFGKKNEIALIAAHGIDEKLHLFEQVVKGLVAAHLPLYDAYAHRGFGQDVLLGRSLIIDVVPLKQAGVVARLLVVGQIVAHYFTDMEIVRELEQHIIRKTKRCDFPERSVCFCKTKCILGGTPTLLMISQNRPAYAGNVKRRLNTIQTPFALRFVASLPPMLSR